MAEELTDLVRAHARFGEADLLIRERRALYRVVARHVGVSQRADDVIDNPVLRAALGRLLGGATGGVAPQEIASMSTLGARRSFGRTRLTIASTRKAARDLEPAFAIVGGHMPGMLQPRLLVEEDAGFLEAAGLVDAGVRLAMEVDPELTADLLAHVDVVAVLDSESSGRLGSASAREYPGLVVFPVPETALVVAEALIHEGAHQKLFDLSVTRTMTTTAAGNAGFYVPSWSPPGTRWPLEQVLAGWHAYSCLTRFAQRLRRECPGLVSADSSLLPVAGVRAAELLRALRGFGPSLGADAWSLIEAISGSTRPRTSPSAVEREVFDADGDHLVVEAVEGGDRRIALVPGTPPTLFWVRDLEIAPASP